MIDGSGARILLDCTSSYATKTATRIERVVWNIVEKGLSHVADESGTPFIRGSRQRSHGTSLRMYSEGSTGQPSATFGQAERRPVVLRKGSCYDATRVWHRRMRRQNGSLAGI
jgi:hypothetical protein